MSDTIHEPTPPRRVRDVVLNLRVTATAKNTVQELADREGRTLSDMGRILLQKGLTEHTKGRKA